MPVQRSSPTLSAADRAAGISRTGVSTGTRGTHLSVSGLSKSYGERRVLTEVSFTASDGDRIGLIGENGTGKSTLLRIMVGGGSSRAVPSGSGPTGSEPIASETADTGSVELPATVGLLSQELPYPEDTPLSQVLDDAQHQALEALHTMEHTAAHLAQHPDDAAAASAYADALEAVERSDAWAAEAKRGDVVAGLGLGGIPESRAISTLSGGQRLRLALTAILLRAPHTLLLDEPSNHLDDASAAYLERVLREWQGIVVVASHDRSLLDAITTQIIDLDPLPIAAAEFADAAPSGAQDAALGSVPSDAALPARVSRLHGHTNPAPQTEAPAPETDDPGAGVGVRVWGMGYSEARAARRAELARWRERYAAESELREALRHEIEVGSREVNKKHESKSEVKMARKFYADKDARVTARRARAARVRLDALEKERVRRPPEPLRLTGIGSHTVSDAAERRCEDERVLRHEHMHDRDEAGDKGRTPLIRAERLGLADRLAPTSFQVVPGGRLLLTGPNGAGKSTLLTILAGDLEADSGFLERDPSARVGYLPQEVVFARPELSAAETYRELLARRTALNGYGSSLPEDPSITRRGDEIADERPLDSLGLLAARDVSRSVGSLSVGQRRRVALAALIVEPPDLLLLDEPTNHLSLTLVEELEEALADYPGALVAATHDRWWRSRWKGSSLTLDPLRLPDPSTERSGRTLEVRYDEL